MLTNIFKAMITPWAKSSIYYRLFQAWDIKWPHHLDNHDNRSIYLNTDSITIYIILISSLFFQFLILSLHTIYVGIIFDYSWKGIIWDSRTQIKLLSSYMDSNCLAWFPEEARARVNIRSKGGRKHIILDISI